ncbi:hypothetical protein L209DRAFT_752092 [Thermothelomyces heterothallicus CBS 203.75]
MTTRGDENISPILPLLAGKEISAGHGRVRYIREGALADGVHVNIALGKGKYVCVLRGEQLRSHLAPAVGIRHDGLCVNPQQHHMEWRAKLSFLLGGRFSDIVRNIGTVPDAIGSQ